MATDGSGSSSQFTLLMDAIKKVEDSVDSKLSAIKRDLTSERESADDRLVKKLRLDSKPSFRKKGNEKQFVFNEQVRDKLVDSVASALDQDPPAVEKAKTLIKEGEKMIDVRQKHIKIADRSEFGWATVAEYEEDELADNSDDEKRLFRAEGSAGRKLKRKTKDFTRKKGGTFKRYPAYKPWSGPTATGSGEHAQSSGTAVLAGLLSQQLLQSGPSRYNVAAGGPSTSLGQLGHCFECGKVGHYKKFCPLLRASNQAITPR